MVADVGNNRAAAMSALVLRRVYLGVKYLAKYLTCSGKLRGLLWRLHAAMPVVGAQVMSFRAQRL